MTSVSSFYHKAVFTAYDADKLVKAASKYQSDIAFSCEDKRANMKSIIGLISIRLEKDSKYIVSADGPDEEKAANELLTLVQEL